MLLRFLAHSLCFSFFSLFSFKPHPMFSLWLLLLLQSSWSSVNFFCCFCFVFHVFCMHWCVWCVCKPLFCRFYIFSSFFLQLLSLLFFITLAWFCRCPFYLTSVQIKTDADLLYNALLFLTSHDILIIMITILLYTVTLQSDMSCLSSISKSQWVILWVLFMPFPLFFRNNYPIICCANIVHYRRPSIFSSSLELSLSL